MQNVHVSKGQRLIKWVVIDPAPITVEKAQSLQNKDYPIMGYGFYDFRCVEVPEGYRATWYCGSSCE